MLMSIQGPITISTSGIPEALRPLFWEHQFDHLSWEADAGLIIGRVLSRGTWTDVQSVRRQARDGTIREWIVHTRGRELSRQQLRFWQMLLGLDKSVVDEWLQDPGRHVWDNRAPR